MDSKLRELTYRLIEMAPEAPPFPEESMVQLKPAPSPVAPPRRRSPLVWVAAAAAIVLLVVGLPLILFGPGDDSAPASSMPAPTVTVPPSVTVPPTTVPSPTTAPPTTVPAVADEPPSYFNVGVEETDFSFGYYPGRVVTTSPITVSGGTDPDADVTINGESAERFDLDGYRSTVDLVPGENAITVVATRGGESIEETLVVRYVPDLTVEIAYLTQVGGDEIVADYIQWLTGDEANQAAFEDGVIGSVEEGVPNGFYIRNVNDQLRTLTLTPSTTLVLVDSQESAPLQVPVADWAALFQPDGSPWDPAVDELPRFPAVSFNYYTASFTGTPYWLYLDADGTVIHIEQQYLP
jgi:hypothetical protein